MPKLSIGIATNNLKNCFFVFVCLFICNPTRANIERLNKYLKLLKPVSLKQNVTASEYF